MHVPGLTFTVAVVFVLILGCGGRQRPARKGEVVVARVGIEGNRTVGGSALLGGLALTRLRDRGEDFEPYLVKVDEDRLRGYYLRRGHFRVVVRSKVVTRDRDVDVLFVIDEGPRAVLARIDIVGLPDDPRVSEDELRRLIRPGIGAAFDYDAYELAKPQLIDVLERNGYAHARLEGTVAADRVLDEAIIRLEIDPGPLCQFGEIRLVGIDGSLAEAARARLHARRGDRYSSEAVVRSQNDLYAMGRFAVVRVDVDRAGRSPVVPVTVTIAESARNELRLGGGVAIDPVNYQGRTRAGYRIAGWPEPLTIARVELRPAYTILRDDHSGQPRLEALGALERLDLFRRRMRAEIEASFAYLTLEAYTSVGPRLRLGLRTPIGRDRVNVAVGWQLRVLDFRRLDPAINKATAARLGLDDTSYMLGFYEQSVSVDLRDDPVAPRRGVFGELHVEEGTLAAGGELTYLRLTPDLRAYLPLGPLVLASRIRVGAIIGDLPVTERFFAGGASSQRGFPARQLAPTVSRLVAGVEESVVIGGGGALEVGAELRASLGSIFGVGLGGVVFLDGADVTERIGELDVLDLHWAAGAGLRVLTPIGPVRLDVGYRLNRTGVGEPAPDDHVAYHLSLGEAF